VAEHDEADRGIAVIDLDGVLADVRHRVHPVKRRPKDWAAFFASAREDPVLPEGLSLVHRLAAEHTIVYLSGRPEHTRQDTQAWLDEHGAPAGEVVLRRRGDFRPARVTKVELLGRLAARGRIALVVDDDALVVEAVRSAGFPVLHADWMPEPPALREAQEVDGAT
jgi:phosphoglycolate phosphatase-like HAD superfamily hydrolase